MITAKVRFPMGPLREFQRYAEQRLERAALISSDRAARTATNEIRAAMRGAALGRLGNVIGATSDLAKTGRVHRRGAGFSASGVVFIRSKSERATGAIQSYTEGSEITPKKGGWLWIATDNIPARAGRFKMTPARYVASGLEGRIGPLVFVPGRHSGEALLVVPSVTVKRSGARGSALSRKNRVGANREARDVIVAFVGIKRTSRQARVDPVAIIRANQARLPEFISAALGRN